MSKADKPTNISSLKTFVVRLVAGVLLVDLFVIFLACFFLNQSRIQYEQLAEARSLSLSQLLAQNIGESIEKIDLTLLATVDEIQKQLASSKIENLSLETFLSRQLGRVPEMGRLMVINAQGKIIFGGGTVKPRINVSERDYFIRLRNDPSAKLVIGKPVWVVVVKVWTQPFARRINNSDGSFAGVVIGSIRLEHFQKLFSSIDVGKNGVVSLRDKDLAVVVRYPESKVGSSDVGQNIVSQELQELLASGKSSGTYKTIAHLDNIERIYSYFKISGYPKYLVVGLATRDFLAPWHKEIVRITSLVSIFILLTLYFSWLQICNRKREKQSEKNLYESEEKFRAVAYHTYDWEYWKDADGGIIYMSPSCERISGYTPEQFQQDPDLLISMMHPDDRDIYRHNHDFDANGPASVNCQVMDFRIHTRSGEERWIAHVCQEIYDEQGASLGRRSCNRDITLRKTIEKSLATNQAELQAIYDNAPVMMCLVNTERRIIYANHAFTLFTGISQEDLEGGHACGVFGCVNALDNPRGCGHGLNCRNCSLIQAIDDTFKSRNPHLAEEHNFTINRDGNRQNFTLLVSIVCIDSTSTPRLLLCLQDISELTHLEQLKQSEEALKRQNALFASLLKNLSVGVFMVEAQSGKPLLANDAALSLLGQRVLPDVTMDNLSEACKAFKVGANVPYPPEGMPIVLAMSGKASHVDDMVIERPDGTRINLEIYGSPIVDDHGHIWASLVSFADITAHKTAENIIQNYNKELEHIVNERTRSLEDANYELIVLNKELDQRRLEAEKNREKLLQLSTAVENSPVTIVIADKLGNIEYVNPRFTEISGYQAEEVIGQNPRLLKADNQPKLLYQELWETILAGKVWRGDLCNKKKSGDIFWEHASISPICDDDGTITHFVAIKDDITEQRHLLEELLNARDAADSAKERLILATKVGGIGICEYDIVNNMLVWDDQMFHLYRVRPEEFTGTYDTWRMRLHPDDLQRCDQEVQFALQGKKKFDTEFRVVWPDSSIRHVRAIANVQRDNSGRPLYIIGTNWDITDFKHTEAQLKNVSDQLKQKNEELEKALVTVEQAGRAKGEFLSNMSHEIRTPLNAIIGFSALTLKAELPPRQQDFIGKIHSAAELLLNIINDILDFSKIEAGQMEMEQIPFRLNIIISNAASMVQQKALERCLNLRIGTPPDAASYLVGDPHRLSQIIVNLLNNAVKFTEHGEIVFETMLLEQQDERVRLIFSIKDTGIGISAEQLARLFKPFTQADGSNSRRFGGTGLGLTISKQLVENMGGEIWCESTPEEGTTFSFTAWFSRCREDVMEQYNYSCATITDNMRPSFDFTGRRVLLVEDIEINRQLAIELLKDTGVVVDIAENGEEAVAIVTGGAVLYDLVLMDIQMPVMDGYEATRIIREDSRFASLPIIAMTAHAMVDAQQKILEADIDAHITKPIEARTMLQVMKFFLQEHESNAGLREKREVTVTNEVVIPEIAGLDTEAALGRLDGDRNLYLWVQRAFVENQANATQLIEEALNAGDTKLAARQAHTIKGIAGAIGAVKLEELALAFEAAINGGKPAATIRNTLEDFATEMARLVGELKVHLPAVPLDDDNQEETTFDVAVVRPILIRLREYIKGRDGRAERYLEDYGRELAGLPHNEIVQIQKFLTIFDFAAADKAVTVLAARNGIDLATEESKEYHS